MEHDLHRVEITFNGICIVVNENTLRVWTLLFENSEDLECAVSLFRVDGKRRQVDGFDH